MSNNKFRGLQSIFNFLHRIISVVVNKITRNDLSIFKSKIVLIVISLLISVFLWIFVVSDNNTEATRTVSVNIKYINLPNGYSIYAPSRTAELKIAGKVNLLSTVDIADLVAEVDLTGLLPGKYMLPIRLDVPSFVIIRSWKPSVAEVEIFREIERTFKITPKIEGNIPEGKIVKSISFDNPNVVITGDEIEVMSIETVEAVIDLKKLDKEGKTKVQMKVLTSTGAFSKSSLATRRLQMSASETNAIVKFEDEIVGERIPVKVSVIGEPQEGLQVESIKIIPDSVSVRGKNDVVKKMQSLVLPPIDISGLDQNIQVLIPMRPAELLPGIEITDSEKARVEINLSKKISVKTFSYVPISVVGNGNENNWSISPQAASVTIEGTQNVIDALGNSNIPCKLYVDISDIVSDALDLPILVKNLRHDIQIVKTEPEQVHAVFNNIKLNK